MDSSAVPKSVGSAGEVIESSMGGVIHPKPMSNLAFESGQLASQKSVAADSGAPVAPSVPDDQARMQKYGGLAKKSTPHMLLNRRKPQKNYFDSGDYNMARQLGAGRGQGMKSRPALSSMVTGTMAPTPEAVEMTRHPHHEQSKLVDESISSSNAAAAPTSAGMNPSGAVSPAGSTFSANVTATNGHSSNDIPANASNSVNSSDVAMEDASCLANNSHFNPSHIEDRPSIDNSWNSGLTGGPGQHSANN